MPSHIYPVPEVERSVLRPSILSVIRDVLHQTQLTDKEVVVNMLGDSESVPVPGSTINSPQTLEPNRLSSDESVTIEVEYADDDYQAMVVRQQDNHPIFHDPKLQIEVKPIYARVDIQATVRYVGPSRSAANRWLNNIRRRCAQSQFVYHHTVGYHYPVPVIITEYLGRFQQMRLGSPTNQGDFGEWLKQNMTTRWDIVNNMLGNKPALAIVETQTNIQGLFDFGLEPKPGAKNDSNAGSWVVEFGYEFSLQRPDSMVFTYPLVIGNQMIPVELIAKTMPDNMYSYQRYQGMVAEAFNAITNEHHSASMVPHYGVKYPYFDDWYPVNKQANYVALTSTLITVDTSDPTNVANLSDLSDSFSFTDDFLSYMKVSGKKMFTQYDSIFLIKVHRWDQYGGADSLRLEPDLTVRTAFDMNPDDMWHICVYMLANPLFLSDDGWDDLLNNCAVFRAWYATIFGWERALKIRCNTDGTVNEDDLEDELDKVKDETGGKGDGNTSIIDDTLIAKAIGQYTIITHRGESNA